MKKLFTLTKMLLCIVPSLALAAGSVLAGERDKLESCLKKTGYSFNVEELFQDELPLVYEEQNGTVEKPSHDAPRRLYDFNLAALVFVKNGRTDRSSPLMHSFSKVPANSPVQYKIGVIRDCLQKAGYATPDVE